MTDPMTELWSQPRIAREFGVAPNTVQGSWRNTTLQVLRDHVTAFLTALPADSGMRATDVLDAVGPAARLTATRWARIRDRFGMTEPEWPDAALPLPDIEFDGKPGWYASTMRAWAVGTKRVDAFGGLRRGTPPGRPPKIPRPKTTTAAVVARPLVAVGAARQMLFIDHDPQASAGADAWGTP